MVLVRGEPPEQEKGHSELGWGTRKGVTPN